MRKSIQVTLFLLFVMPVTLGVYGCSDDSDPVILSFNSVPGCTGLRGNVDGDPDDCCSEDDIAYLIDFMFERGPQPACWSEADVNGDGFVDIADLAYLMDFVKCGGRPPVPCPGWNI